MLSREHLSEEDHAHILQKMVAGSIASRETIIESLDRSGLPLSIRYISKKQCCGSMTFLCGSGSVDPCL
jgi:hypothetical protein